MKHSTNFIAGVLDQLPVDPAMRHLVLRAVAAIGFLLCVLVTPSVAQYRFFATVNLSDGSHALAAAPLTTAGLGALQPLVFLPGTANDIVVTVDGRFVAWFANEQLTVFDVRTGAVIPVASVTNSVGFLFADPSETRVYRVPMGENVSMTTIDQTGIRLVPIGQVTRRPASNGRDLFVVRQVPGSGSPPIQRIAAIDMATGAEKYQLAADFQATAVDLAVSDDGTRVAVAEHSTGSIKLFDTATRAEIASRVMPQGGINSSYTPLAFDQQRNRLFVGYTYIPFPRQPQRAQVLVLDATTLGDIGEGTVLAFPDFAQSPRNDIATNTVCSTVETWGAANTPAMLQSSQLPSGLCFGATAIASAPSAMSAVTSQVAGRRVTLSWTAVAGANDYVTEAGSSPGSSNLARFQTAGASQLVVDHVPSGTYYVRVRPMNDVGFGAVSAELTIVVP